LTASVEQSSVLTTHRCTHSANFNAAAQHCLSLTWEGT